MVINKRLYVRQSDNKLVIGLAASGYNEQTIKAIKLDKVKTYDINFTPSTFLELQKMKSLYTVTKTLINKLSKVINNLDLSIMSNRLIARDRLTDFVNQENEDFRCIGIVQRKNTSTGEVKNFLDYGLMYYLAHYSTSSYSVWLKNESWIETGRTYHSDYLDLDIVHQQKDFDDINNVVIIDCMDEQILDIESTEIDPTEAELEAIEAELEAIEALLITC